MTRKTYAFASGTEFAYGSLRKYNKEHPELPQLVRESNAAAKFDMHEVSVLIDAYAMKCLGGAVCEFSCPCFRAKFVLTNIYLESITFCV